MAGANYLIVRVENHDKTVALFQPQGTLSISWPWRAASSIEIHKNCAIGRGTELGSALGLGGCLQRPKPGSRAALQGLLCAKSARRVGVRPSRVFRLSLLGGKNLTSMH